MPSDMNAQEQTYELQLDDIETLDPVSEVDTRIYRTSAQVLGAIPDMDYRWTNPVPVFSGPRLLGAATLEARHGAVYADLLLDYETPERLDAENQNLWVHPDRVTIGTTYRPCECGTQRIVTGRVMTIGSLRLHREPMDSNLPPIGEPLL